ncbi:hypothetical protein D5S17_17890 [Pseudonocardiaceae bacterium YIM PH 21723]|nr:hypothetical protein D5S17_17890 [Pseudonocardiaceae bacterium YIM PH 21723]
MLIPGVVTGALRQLPVQTIIELAGRAGLRALTVSADPHLAAGQLSDASRIGVWCANAGLQLESYATGCPLLTDELLETAAALGAPTVRVLAGDQSSETAGLTERWQAIDALHRCAVQAAEYDLAVAVEFQPGTLADSAGSTLRLLAEVDHPNLIPYWQAPPLPELAPCQWDLRMLLPALRGIQVYSLGFAGFRDRRSLAHRADLWPVLLAQLAADGHDRFAMLAYLLDDSEESLTQDTTTLLRWLG